MLRKLNLLRRVIILLSFVIALVCIVLLLNITAANPTGRRYSSESPVIQGTSQSIGISGERILAADLNTIRNERSDMRQCICQGPGPRSVSECRVCSAYAQITSSYRRPDFVTGSYIAESKNGTSLLYSGREVDQIGDYVIAARALGIPLWVYTRVDTRVDAEFMDIVRTTGGDVVPYFTVPDYVDPVDQAATSGLLGALGVLFFMGFWETSAQYIRRRPKPPKRDKPRRPRGRSNDPVSRAMRTTKATEDFQDDAEESARHDIDIEDARHDDQ